MLHFPCLTYCVDFFTSLLDSDCSRTRKILHEDSLLLTLKMEGHTARNVGGLYRLRVAPPLITSKEMEPQYYNHKELNSALAMGAWKRTPSSRWEGTTLFSIDLICQPYLYHEPFTTTEICPIFASSWNSFPFFSPYFLYQAFQFKACNNPLNCQIIKEKIIKSK